MRRSIGEYPPAWLRGEIQREVKDLASHRCECCGLEFNENTNRSLDGNIVGGCHHIDHDRSNNSLGNLVYLCQRCHLDVHRWSWKPGDELPRAWRNKMPRWIQDRQLPYTTYQRKLWRDDDEHPTRS